jgi:hypothetical protein
MDGWMDWVISTIRSRIDDALRDRYRPIIWGLRQKHHTFCTYFIRAAHFLRTAFETYLVAYFSITNAFGALFFHRISACAQRKV